VAALACSSNLATRCPSWGKSPWLAYNHHPSQPAAYPFTVSPWLCLLLPLHHVPPFLACSCSPARPVIHSPQSVLVLLALIPSLVWKASQSIQTLEQVLTFLSRLLTSLQPYSRACVHWNNEWVLPWNVFPPISSCAMPPQQPTCHPLSRSFLTGHATSHIARWTSAAIWLANDIFQQSTIARTWCQQFLRDATKCDFLFAPNKKSPHQNF
jgi:hypothetical protein